ncbi:MAG: mRNA surveillance protein pelota [Candidatus Bathyarchaeota archaeon]|nr:mRNA surveillance protein pelota [Candidatus Bathyarchaeota archaeon]MDH5747053.1 mRNA surveillance protein pelota [Candidatus Bathyarchaeota archaeon]
MNLKKGFVKVIPETFDDLWHLYNVIYRGDEVYAYTKREIKPDEKYARPRRGQRVPVFLGVKVEKIVWDKLLGRLRVHGTICKAPETVPIGAHHTLNIALNKPLTIVKRKWARHHVERLKRARKTSEKPITIIAIDDEGYAIATTKQYGVEVKVEERIRLPGKLEAEKRSAAIKEYFRKALSSLRQVWTATRSPIAIIGVGFVKNDFAKFLESEAADVAKSVLDVKGVNNGGVAGIYEALRSGVLLKVMKYLRVVEETETMEEILKRLGKGESNITYGLEEVKKAAQLGAIEKLVLADTMLRETSAENRLLLEDLMKIVEQKGGKIMIISTEHEAGAKLLALGGIAALLRFSLYQNLYQ